MSSFLQTFGFIFCADEGLACTRSNGVDELMTHLLGYYGGGDGGGMPVHVMRGRNMLLVQVGRSEDGFDINIPLRHSEKLRSEAERGTREKDVQ